MIILISSFVYRGPPLLNCVDAINTYVTSYASTIAGISIAIGLLMSLGVIGSFIVICCLGTKLEINAISTYKYEILEENIF